MITNNGDILRKAVGEYMYSETTIRLSDKQRENLVKVAAYERTLGQQRLITIAKGMTFYTALVVGIAGFISGISWLFGSVSDLWDSADNLLWIVGIFALFGLYALWNEGRFEHVTASDMAADAKRALGNDNAVQIAVTIDESTFSVQHDHGLIVVTGEKTGGSRLLEISIIADDPREDMATMDAVPRKWTWTEVPGTGVRQDFSASGKPMPLRRYLMEQPKDYDWFFGLVGEPEGDLDGRAISLSPNVMEAEVMRHLRPA